MRECVAFSRTRAGVIQLDVLISAQAAALDRRAARVAAVPTLLPIFRAWHALVLDAVSRRAARRSQPPAPPAPPAPGLFVLGADASAPGPGAPPPPAVVDLVTLLG